MNVVTQFSTYTHFNALNLLILNAILWSMMTLSRFGDISILIRFDWLIFRKKTFDPTWSHTKLLFIFFFSLLCILRMNKWNHLQWMFCYCFYHIKTVMGCFVLFFAITSFVQMRSIYFSKIFQLYFRFVLSKLAIVVAINWKWIKIQKGSQFDRIRLIQYAN